MKRILLILMFGMFLISLVSAEVQTLGTFKQGDCINLIQTCDSCTYNNISYIIYPNSSVALSNVAMTRDDTYYNYILCYTSALGDYIVNGFGDLDGVKTIWVYDFKVTQTGTILKTSDSITYLILIFGVLLFFLLCLYGGIVLPFRNDRDGRGKIISVQKLKYFKLACLFTSYILFVWLANLLFALANNFNILQSYVKFFEVMFSVINSFSYPMFVLMFISILFLAWKDLQLKKLLERGLTD